MKKEELRIGNWYLSVKFGVPVRCELSDLYELCVMSDGAYNDPPIGEMFKPILLTNEWLMELGFWRHNNLRRRWLLAESIVEANRWEEGNFYIYKEKNRISARVGYGRGSTHLAYLKYVHQLQDLYFVLTGEELKTV